MEKIQKINNHQPAFEERYERMMFFSENICDLCIE